MLPTINSDWLRLGVYVATLVWGAATMRAELRNLRVDMKEFKKAVGEASKVMTETMGNHGERISRIEGRLGK